MNQPRKRSVSHLATAIGFSAESVGMQPQVLMVGKERLRAQPCTRLLAYRSECVRVRIGTRILGVYGTELCVRTFCGGLLEIEGSLCRVEWEEEQR